jgi:hypothetical protein
MDTDVLSRLRSLASKQHDFVTSLASTGRAASDLIATMPVLDLRVAHQISTFAKRLGEADRRAKQFEPNARYLGASGWTLPTQLPTDQILDILGGIERKGDYDDLFEEYYNTGDRLTFRELAQRLSDSNALKVWQALIRECIECFDEGRYQVILPALLVVLEGCLMDATSGSVASNKVKAATSSRRKASKSGLERLLWASIEGFTFAIFENIQFNQGRPRLTNRHWVLHGRDRAGWKPIDALRLFHAIDSVRMTLRDG